MTWTAPRTWNVSEIVTAAMLNLHVRDNLNYLKGNAGVVAIAAGMSVAGTFSTTGVAAIGAGMTVAGTVAATGDISTVQSSAPALIAQGTANASLARLSLIAKTSGGANVEYRWLANALGLGELLLYDNIAPAARLHVGSNGNVGIGITPQAKLHAQGVGGGFLYLSATTVNATLQTLTSAGLVTTGAVFFINDINNGTLLCTPNTLAIGIGATSYYLNGDTITFGITAGGAITMQRTSGSNSHQVNTLCVYY